MKKHYILKSLFFFYIAFAFLHEAKSQSILYTLENTGNILKVKMKAIGGNVTVNANAISPSLEFYIAWPDNVNVNFATPVNNSTTLPGMPTLTTQPDSGIYGGLKYAHFATLGLFSSTVTYLNGVEYEVMTVNVSGSTSFTDFSLKANQNGTDGTPWYATFYTDGGTNVVKEGPGVQAFYGLGISLVGNEATMSLTNVPLPVKFGDFSADYNDKTRSVYLKWQTLQENNTDHFVIERSINGGNFTSIGTIPSKASGGSSATPLDYDFTHNDIKPGTIYYRVKLVDGEGKSHFTMVRIVKISDDEKALRVYPNPVTTTLNIAFGHSGNAKLSLYTVDGRLVQTTQLSVTAGQIHSVNVNQLKPGLYYLEVFYSDGKRIVEKLIKK